jgi:hypothetical protein
MLIDRLYGQEYIDWFVTTYNLQPRYVPRPNPDQTIDQETGEIDGPDVLFAANPAADWDRPHITEAIKATRLGKVKSVFEFYDNYYNPGEDHDQA